jgi:hypothetical protein
MRRSWPTEVMNGLSGRSFGGPAGKSAARASRLKSAQVKRNPDVVLSLTYAVNHWQPADRARYVRGAAALCFVAALVSTLSFNVPINAATARWNAAEPPPDWKATRNRWEFFQAVRSWLLLLGFVLLCFACTWHA